jgi:hypothetical protein
MKLIKWHKKLTDKFMRRLGLDWYSIAWISWFKGLIAGLIICHFLLK